MKKTIISIIGIAVMLLAITACRPNYVIVPIPGGGTSSTPSGTPVSDASELQQALEKGEDVYLTKDVVLLDDFQIPENSTIDGYDKTIKVLTGANPGTGIMDLAASGVTLKNVTLDFTAQSVTGASLLSATARAAGDKFAVLIGSGDGNMDNAPSGITLSNVTIRTGGTIAGINVHTAKNVTLEDIKIDNCQKAPISISSSTVAIDGLKADYSSWYTSANTIQVNGMGGSPVHQPSTVTFKSTEGIDAVWVEAVAADYEKASAITDADFPKAGEHEQTVINGLSNWKVRYSDQPSKEVKGWMYYAPSQDASTFTLNEKAANPEADLIAMLTAVAESAEARRYSTIKLAKDITITDTIVVSSKVTLNLNGKTVSPADAIWNQAEGKWSIISVREGGDLTITGNGKLQAIKDDTFAVDVKDDSHLVIENGEFVGNVHSVYVHGGSAEIKGGRYSIQQQYTEEPDKPYEFVLNLLDKEKRDWPATIVVTGGTFEKFNPADNKAEGENTSFVAEGYASTYNESDKTYTVNKKIGV